ncbi:MAG: phosphoribosylformimino-5-aminoimidazole carboxamide ribotide isomerase [Lentimonas sp.]|jgi:phosphoribosylformimino-5-aminoimidazole carboxamide ribotide isomerase
MTRFRPCIDLHQGRVKQIVGGSLKDNNDGLKINFESAEPAGYYAERYQRDRLSGGHVIQLGPNNEAAASEALAAYPQGLQIGGGIHRENAAKWLEAGASHVIVTSWLFDSAGNFQPQRLDALVQEIGKQRLVIDLSCRTHGQQWVVAMNRWQTPTNLTINRTTLESLGQSCAEFLIHAADVEGKCEGIDRNLVRFLGANSPIPCTYAGGVQSIEDLAAVNELSGGTVDLTIGSALDLFGGNRVRYEDCIAWNTTHSA